MHRLKPWQADLVAVVLTAATLGLRLALDGPLGGQPMLVIFTFPIMLSACVGGLRAGLLATLLTRAILQQAISCCPISSTSADTLPRRRQPAGLPTPKLGGTPKSNACGVAPGPRSSRNWPCNREPPATPDEQAPVRAAHRYLANRPETLDYANALAADLPIGSGLIESGYKHLLQARLKRPGAAWLETNAEAVIQLRILRANDRWDEIWALAA